MDIEKLQKIIEREIDNVPMVLTDPLTLRRLRAERLAQAAYAAIAYRIEDLEAEVERLRGALRGVFEEWAGSEGFIPETAPEGYLLHLTKRMADIARAALKGSSRGTD